MLVAHTNGQKSCEGHFNADLAEGSWEFWHPNGQKQMQGAYQNGKRSGDWLTWNADGTFFGEKTHDPEAVVERDHDPADAADAALPMIDGLKSEDDWQVRQGS